MSPVLIKQDIQEALDPGLMTELEASKHLTVRYGGLLLGNAALVEQHVGIRTLSRPRPLVRMCRGVHIPLLTPNHRLPGPRLGQDILKDLMPRNGSILHHL